PQRTILADKGQTNLAGVQSNPSKAMSLQESNVTAIRRRNLAREIVFVHGFTGSRDDTWDRFPSLLGTAVSDWDIFTVGYATTLLPDVVGVWSADPDLAIFSKMRRRQLSAKQLVKINWLSSRTVWANAWCEGVSLTTRVTPSDAQRITQRERR